MKGTLKQEVEEKDQDEKQKNVKRKQAGKIMKMKNRISNKGI